MGMVVAKPQNFGASAKRLLGALRQDRGLLVLVVVLGVLSVGLTVTGPKLLGEATNIVFAGFTSLQFPSGTTQQQVIDQLVAAGQTQQADLLRSMTFVPGSGVDFIALSQVLLLVLAVYVFGSVFALFQARILNGVVQRAMHRLRMQVEDKIHRLPLSYFDRVQRGDLLSRVTNDVDNIGQSLQQTLSQVITSLLTVIGVLVMMFLISPILALIALVTIPLTIVITVLVARRSQKLFVEQWKQTGILNARVEETYSGHALVKVYGHQGEVEAAFADELWRAVHLGHHHASHDVRRKPRLRRYRRSRRTAGRRWHHLDRRRAGVHPVLASVQPAAQPAGFDGEPPPVRRGQRGACVRTPRRGRGGARSRAE